MYRLLNDISGCRRAGFTRAYPHGFTDWRQENLAVTGLSGTAHIGNGFDDGFCGTVVEHDFDAKLGNELHLILGATVVLRVPPLPAVTGDFSDGDPLHAETRNGHLQVVELPRTNDCSDHFHRFGIVIGWSVPCGHAYAPSRQSFSLCSKCRFHASP